MYAGSAVRFTAGLVPPFEAAAGLSFFFGVGVAVVVGPGSGAEAVGVAVGSGFLGTDRRRFV